MMQLPPEYQAEIQRMMRQRALAEALSAQSLGQHPTEMISGRAVSQGGIGGIARALTGVVGQQQVGEADAGINQVQSQYADATQKEMEGILKAPDMRSAIAMAQASRNPQVRAFAAANMQRMQARDIAAGTAIKAADPQGAYRATVEGAVPGYKIPAAKPPEIASITNPDGTQTQMVQNFHPGTNSISGVPVPKTNNIINNQATEDYKDATAEASTELKTKKEEASIAKAGFASNQRALEALQEGAKAGGGEEFLQSIRKAAQFFGFTSVETAPTEKLAMAMGDEVLANARKLAPVTQEDIAQLKQIKGSIGTDPTALAQMLEFLQAKNFKALHDYNSYLDVMKANAEKNPIASLRGRLMGLYGGQEIGYEAPRQLSGSLQSQLGVVKRLDQMGYDVSKLKESGKYPMEP